MHRTVLVGALCFMAVACNEGGQASPSATTAKSAPSAPTTAATSAPKAASATATATASAPASAAAAVDQSKPENVVNAIFEAARNDDPSPLAALCDDSVSKDGDVKRICRFTKDDKNWTKFLEDAKLAKITSTKVEGDKAKVDFTYGKGGEKKETIELAKVGDKWFLAKM